MVQIYRENIRAAQALFSLVFIPLQSYNTLGLFIVSACVLSLQEPILQQTMSLSPP